MEAPIPNVSIAASGQWSQNYNWTVPQGAPANVLVIATLSTAGCDQVIATATVKIGNGGTGPVDPVGPGGNKAKPVPANGNTALLLLSAVLALLGACRAQRRKATR